MSDLAIIATMVLTPGVRDKFVAHLTEHRRRCLAQEPGTFVFEILLPHDAPDTVMLYEIYKDEAAFEAHMTGASIEIMRQGTEGMLISLTGIRCAPAS